MSLYIMNGVYFGYYCNCILFHGKGHFKINLKIYNWWNLTCLAVGGNERLRLILFSLALSFLISALSLLVSLEPRSAATLPFALPLGGSRGAEGFGLGVSTDGNDSWWRRWKSLLITQSVLCQWIVGAAPLTGGCAWILDMRALQVLAVSWAWGTAAGGPRPWKHVPGLCGGTA